MASSDTEKYFCFEEQPLLLFFALLLTRKRCPVLLELLRLPHSGQISLASASLPCCALVFCSFFYCTLLQSCSFCEVPTLEKRSRLQLGQNGRVRFQLSSVITRTIGSTHNSTHAHPRQVCEQQSSGTNQFRPSWPDSNRCCITASLPHQVE